MTTIQATVQATGLRSFDDFLLLSAVLFYNSSSLEFYKNKKQEKKTRKETKT
jgi:hypothetical protein